MNLCKTYIVILFSLSLFFCCSHQSLEAVELTNKVPVLRNPVLNEPIDFDTLLGSPLPERFFEKKGIWVRMDYTPGAGKRGTKENAHGSYTIYGQMRLATSDDSLKQIIFALRLVKNENSEYIVVQVLEQKLVSNPDWAGFSLGGFLVDE